MLFWKLGFYMKNDLIVTVINNNAIENYNCLFFHPVTVSYVLLCFTQNGFDNQLRCFLELHDYEYNVNAIKNC